ncbi:hypothetical protein ACWGCW_25885 [Streptomyces sp. NPDC054933]
MSATTPAASDGGRLIGRCYTKARKHPSVIGRFPGGGTLWGGPYTIPQLLVMTASFGALILTRQLWAHFGLVDILIAIGLPYALGFAVRRVHVDGRNPLAVIASTAVLLGAPRAGRIGGRPVRMRRPRPVLGLCTLNPVEPADVPMAASATAAPGPTAFSLAKSAPQSAPSAPVAVRSAGSASPPPVVSSVQALLAQRRAAAASNHSTTNKE